MPGRGTLEKEKPPIFGLVQRGGTVVLHLLANVQQATIKPLILARVALGSLINTDEDAIYARLSESSMLVTTMATGSARSTSTRWKASGRCYARGCDRTGAFRRRSCPAISPSSSSCTTPDVGAKLCSAPFWRLCCPPPRNPNRASAETAPIPQ
jgi:hypothetical protein